ncbi:hypothetical protein D3C72_2438140 [compost metagenome]
MEMTRAVALAGAVAVVAAAPPFSTKLSFVPVPVFTAMVTPAAVASVHRLTPSKVAPARALVISAPRAL